ncbi:hypothetical protein PULV_a0753 [Pseudoalteromonas ulvae UL12]|uniref:Uncharacterized protein n=1 Tax=Pseudoalteromonas ulvae TaxID=107327 RepID=A0A244CNE7_PSEDV|nr:hypothetical protein [Pseudoalteromonas ulvae]MBE0363119.1 hypothetical protein [Pseudoalteromonas ulvae UL12]OUL57151.1 hypothetical protein B1199_13320 [Pseudoalteromonas ulvae]
MKKLFPLMFAMTLTACSEPTPVASTEQINQLSQLDIYKTATKELVALIKSAKQDSEVELHAKTLVDISKVIIDDFIVVYPQCKEYLGALTAAADTIHTLPLEEIESGYHADGKLPKFSDPNCYHAKDLLVHPATVQAMAKLGLSDPALREKAEHELIEVLAHFSQVETVLGKG